MTRCPCRPGNEVLQRRVLGVHGLLARRRPDLAVALLVQTDGAAIEIEGTRCQVDHRPEYPVEVQGGGDLSTDLEEQWQIPRPLLHRVQLGIPERGSGTGGEALEQLAVSFIE